MGYDTQGEKILAHLKAGNVITPLDALAMFQCFRLSGRILELRNAGYRIETTMRKVASGKHVAEYRLVA